MSLYDSSGAETYPELPNRKHNRLENFDYSGNGAYFVTICIKDRKPILSDIVCSIKILTTKEIGKPIFRRSYSEHIIRNQKDYDEIWQYFENNPAKGILMCET